MLRGRGWKGGNVPGRVRKDGVREKVGGIKRRDSQGQSI